MLFALNASLNGNFQGTFSKAQQEFAKLGREIQELHKVQANISSYQKQEQAVASTTAKLSNLQQQSALLEQQITATRDAENQDAAAVAALEREKLKLEQRIKSTEEALERQNQRLEATGERLKEAGVNTADLAQADAQLMEKLKELQAQQEKAAEGAASFGERAAQGFEAAGSALAAAGIADALGEIKDAYMECVTIAANFEEGMSNVEALSGSTAQEMAELTAKAKELGAETKYTAMQSSEAMGYMAMAGWDAQEMLSGMSGVIDLAAASGEDLAMVSDIVTDNLTAFGLTAADTARFADVLAAAATGSNTSVSIMGETFKQSASIAGALGYSIEDVAVGVGLMANAGVKGSIAGTALKNTFNGLLEGVTLTSAAFGEYEFTAIKADGAMQDFAGTINELRGYFDQMTEAERVSNAMAIAGQYGYNGLLAILNATEADYQSLTDSINSCSGAAQRMAGIKMDNLKGQLTLMNSAWEAVQTTIGEQFNPELRELAGLGTDMLGWVNDFIQAHPALTKGVMTFTGVMGAAAVAITGVNAALKLFQALNMAALFTGPVGAVLGVSAAIAGVAAAVVGMTTAMDDGIPTVRELTEAARELDAVTRESAAAYDESAGAAEAAASVADTYIGKLEQMGDYTRLSAQEQEQYRNTLALLCQVVPELSGSIDVQTGRIEGGTAALRANAEAWKQNAMAQAYQERLTALYAAQADVLIEAEKNSIELTRAQYELEAASQEYNETLERMNALMGESYDAGKDLPAEYNELEMSLGDLESRMTTARKEVEVYTQATEAGSEAAEAARAEIDLLAEAAGHLTDQTAEQTDALPELQAAITPVRAELEQLTAAYNDAYDAAVESISGQYSLWDQAAEVAATSAGSINAALENQITYWQDYDANLQRLTERAAGIEGLGALIATFADGSADSVNAIAGMADASNEDLQKMVSNWRELQAQQSETAGSLAELAAGFPEQMEHLVTAMEEGVEGMSLPDEAQESARSTIQAFIDEAANMLPAVRQAYADLGRTAANTLGLDLHYTSRGHSGDAGDHLAAYASGTSNAPPGWAWVGEEGPELMRMRGGETILPAEVSREYALLSAYQNEIAAYTGGTGDVAELTGTSNAVYAAYEDAISHSSSGAAETAVAAVETIPSAGYGAGAGTPVVVEIHIHLEGSAAPETVQALEDYVRRGELREAVEDAMENIQIDARRGAY